MKIKWKEVFKFLSGAALAGSFANGYFYYANIPVTVFGFTFSPELLGWRALIQFVLFLVFFYYGYMKKK